MHPYLNPLPPEAQLEISQAIYAGRTVDAIKRYREHTQCSLTESKQKIDAIRSHLQETHPQAFLNPRSSGGCGGCLGVLLLLLILGFALPKLPDLFFEDGWDWRAFLSKKGDEILSKALEDPDVRRWIDQALARISKASPPREAPPKPVPPPANPPQSLSRIQNRPLILPAPAPAYEPRYPNEPEKLARLYQKKLANPDYLTWMNRPGIPQGYQDFDEEHRIKAARSQLAQAVKPPANATVHEIPGDPTRDVEIDGVLRAEEWRQALSMALLPLETETVFFLEADSDWLYIAAEVPGDTTPSGFDQLRFYVHVNLDPIIRNERLHVDGRGQQTPTSIRETTVTWRGAPPVSENERWKKYPISDWNIYRMAQGAASVQGYRRFEAKIHRKEAGLSANAPFAAFVEVESDPIYDHGKFRERTYLGKLGDQQNPVWFKIQAGL